MIDAPILRPYQLAALADLSRSYATRHRAPLLVMPTGAGKTIIIAEAIARATRLGRRTLVVSHRQELIRQASDKLRAAGVPHGIIAPGYPKTSDMVQIGSVQTLAKRLDRLPLFNLIVLDEAHHAVAGQWKQLLLSQPQARLLGVTATPERLDGRGLGIASGGPFDDLMMGPSVGDLIAGGFLVPARVFAPSGELDLSGVRIERGDFRASDLEVAMSRPALVGDAVEHYRRHAGGMPAIAFCVTVQHAQDVALAFRAAGWRAIAVHGRMDKPDRDAAINGLATGAVDIVCTCDLISEGLDVPGIGAVLLMRPTQSLGLHLQQIGRGLRPAPGKLDLVVLDHAGNSHRHGLPEDARSWSLNGRTCVDRESRSTKQSCLTCRRVQAGGLACVECGRDVPAPPPQRAPLTARGRLTELRQIPPNLRYSDIVAGNFSKTQLRGSRGIGATNPAG